MWGHYGGKKKSPTICSEASPNMLLVSLIEMKTTFFAAKHAEPGAKIKLNITDHQTLTFQGHHI